MVEVLAEMWLQIIPIEMDVIQAIRAAETQEALLQIIVAIPNAQVTAIPITDQGTEVIPEVIIMEVTIVPQHLQDPMLQVLGVVPQDSEVVPPV